MPKRPPPTKSAERVKRYLDIIESMEKTRGRARKYDIYREAMNQPQTDRMIQFFVKNGLITGDDAEGYERTADGRMLHDMLKKHRNLVGIFTRLLSGVRIRQW
jgi:Mn-dependent DtxR family transcriptional regulator